MVDLPQLVFGALLALIIAGVSWRLRALSTSGSVATAILGTIVFGLGGLKWSLPLITFFVLSSLLSRMGTRGARSKERFETVFEKGSQRDAGQVIANGGVAGALALAAAFADTQGTYYGLFAAYVGALAAAAADTWGTEIGVLGRGKVISIATLREVPPGTSGGVSLLGTIGAAAGALSVSLSALPWAARPWLLIVTGVVSGLVGMIVDSLIGALAQARYRCGVCGAVTERREHCGRETDLTGGYRWITNDAVNVICCFTGAVAALILAVALT